MTKKVQKEISSTPLFQKRFKEETRVLLASRTWSLFLITTVLYPTFSGLDWLMTSFDNALIFLYIRIGVAVNFLFCALLLKFPIGKKMVLPISVWGGYVSILGVAIMTVFLGGFLSQYYVGIVLIIFIPGLFLPWNLFATIIFGISSIATYLILNFTMGNQDWTTMMLDASGPFFFMTWSFAYMAFANVEKEKTRRKELLLRMQVETANEDLKELDKAKMRFFSNVSHELRTPLTLIIGPLEQLVRKSAKADTAPILRAMEANAHRLLRQVNIILDFAKVDAGKLKCHHKKGNVGKILSELVMATRPYTDQKKIALIISGSDALPDTPIDVEKVETIAANLISNAVKFTPEQGNISIAMGTDKYNVWFEVQDTGVGIPEEKVDIIFDRFLQVEDTHSRRNEGTGLGLAMVKELTMLHGGKVEVRSKIGEGSTFRVSLPRKPRLPKTDRRRTAGRRKSDQMALEKLDALIEKTVQERVQNNKKTLLADVVGSTGLGRSVDSLPPGLPGQKNKKSADHTILVVEDNLDLRAFVVGNLVDNYRVLQAENGRVGLDLARRMNPDLILSDVMMPEMDGYELCREIRRDPLLSTVPVILVTAKSGGEAVEEGLECGASDYVSKPFEMRELKARIASQLKSRNLEKNINERDTRLAAIGQVTSSVVYDLRNPLNNILGFIRVAQQDACERSPEEMVSHLEMVTKSCTHLDDKITQIIDFSRGYLPRLNMESTLLKPFLESTLNVYRSRLTPMDISLVSRYESCDDIEVNLDGEQINRVIDILIMNIKEQFFNAANGGDKKIQVLSRRDDDNIVIRFADNGPGLTEATRNALFEPFDGSEKKSDTELGLATIRNIVSAHSGEIIAEPNKEADGTVVAIKLPICKL